MNEQKNCDTQAEWLALRRNGIGASFGEIGGITWSLKSTTRKAYTVEEKTYRTLRRGK